MTTQFTPVLVYSYKTEKPKFGYGANTIKLGLSSAFDGKQVQLQKGVEVTAGNVKERDWLNTLARAGVKADDPKLVNRLHQHLPTVGKAQREALAAKITAAVEAAKRK